MNFKTGKACEDCNAEIVVYPASVKMGVINGRSLPGWKRCECLPRRLNEITSAEFDALVPGWRDRLVPDEEELPDCSFDEALEDVKNLADAMYISGNLVV